jgi:hypothetical protein
MLNPNPAVGTEANQFQSFINQYFNTIVPSNAGKWAYNEQTQGGSITMTLVDQQLNYAQSHNMRARMHNLIWGSGSMSGSQQPASGIGGKRCSLLICFLLTDFSAGLGFGSQFQQQHLQRLLVDFQFDVLLGINPAVQEYGNAHGFRKTGNHLAQRPLRPGHGHGVL